MTTYFELNKENRELKAKINLLDNRIDNLNRDIALRDDQMLRLRDNNRDSERRLRNTLNNERT
jgi:hypothetical protein